MDSTLKRSKQALRAFMRANYSDERLAMLFAHAKDGKLICASCCCFIGVLTADHALQSEAVVYIKDSVNVSHLERARLLPGAAEAEEAFQMLGYAGVRDWSPGYEVIGRRRLISIVKAEMKRREAARTPPRLPEPRPETAERAS